MQIKCGANILKFEIRTQYRIEAARFLPLLSNEHPCSRTHGHSFVFTLILHSELNPKFGWTMDYHEIDQIWNKEIKAKIDHQLLNTISGLENPTTEILCAWIFNKLENVFQNKLIQIIGSETPNTECRYPII